MKLTINTDLCNQNLINNHGEFITFLDNYFILDDNYLQSKYKLNELAIYIYQELEKDNKFIFQKTKKISHESKIFKTNYSVNYKCILSDSLIQRLNLSKYHTMQDIYFTKKKISRKGDYLFKSFTFHQDNYLAYFAILNEIVLQIYANYLSLGNNSFYVPLIWEVRKEITKHNDIKIDIIMDFVHENKVSDTTQLQYSICDALARLEEFNLYHNDTHRDNILIMNQTEFAIIDFGQASINDNYFNSEYSITKSSNEFEFINWLDRKKISVL